MTDRRLIEDLFPIKVTRVLGRLLGNHGNSWYNTESVDTSANREEETLSCSVLIVLPLIQTYLAVRRASYD